MIRLKKIPSSTGRFQEKWSENVEVPRVEQFQPVRLVEVRGRTEIQVDAAAAKDQVDSRIQREIQF